MATKLKDAAVVTGKYIVNGQDKSRWKNVEALYQKDDGSMFLRLDVFFNFSALPRNEGSDSVFIGLFNPKPRDDSLSRALIASTQTTGPLAGFRIGVRDRLLTFTARSAQKAFS